MTDLQKRDPQFPALRWLCLGPSDFGSNAQRAAMIDWLKANESYRPGIHLIALDMVDAPVVRISSYAGAPGERVLGSDGKLQSITRDYLIRVPPQPGIVQAQPRAFCQSGRQEPSRSHGWPFGQACGGTSSQLPFGRKSILATRLAY